MFAVETKPAGRSDEELIAGLDIAQAAVGRAERERLRFITQVAERDIWTQQGARDAAHFVCMRLGISAWKARRLIGAAQALEHLPRISEALVSGMLSLEKVAELTRFATPQEEAKLIGWANTVSCAAIRHRGDLAARRTLEEILEAEETRGLSWWYSADGTFVGLQAELPAAQGTGVIRAIKRMAEQVPVLPGEDDEFSASRRRADALVALCSGRAGRDTDPDRATVIVHAQLQGLHTGSGGCEVEAGPVLDPRAVRRMLCDARVQTLVEDEGGNVLGVGRMHREPPAWMTRQVRYRDRECRFPGCGARRFTQAHHVRFWSHGGRTELHNLLLICSFHHRLVHEYGWSVRRARDGTVRWRRPGGTEYRAGPSPGGRRSVQRC